MCGCYFVVDFVWGVVTVFANADDVEFGFPEGVVNGFGVVAVDDTEGYDVGVVREVANVADDFSW